MFQDAQKLHKESPESFWAPTADELSILKGGDFVKVCAGNERFWVEVTAVSDKDMFPSFKGVIDNKLVKTTNHGLRLGDEVTVPGHCVYDYLPVRNLKPTTIN